MLSLPPADQASTHPQLELLPKLLNPLFKWKWLIVLMTFAVALPVALVLFFRTPTYEVKMRILIKSARAQAAMNLTGGQSVISPAVTLPILNSEIQVLKSLDLLIPAIQQSGYPLLASDQEDTPLIRERALLTLRGRMNYSPVPDSNVIEVSVVDADPKAAAGLLNALAALYFKKHATLQAGGENTHEFFTRQVALHKARLENRRDLIEKFSAKDNIINLNAEMEANLTRLLAMENTLKELQGELESGTKEIAALERQLKDQPEEITRERTVMVNPEVTAMRTKLVDLERQRDELLQRFTPANRLVKDKESEIVTLKAAIEAREQTVVGNTVVAQNTVRNALSQQLVGRRAAVEAIAAKRSALLEEKKAYEQRLQVLKDRSFDYQRLRGEFEVARDNYFMYEKKAEEARVSRAMDEENIVNAGIIQQARPPLIALPRNLLMWGPVSAMAGCLLGVALALALEFFNPTLKDETDVERFLQVPVLATVRHF
jgi:uncharacterized protein involved in exopolysaccharide biosynthesis